MADIGSQELGETLSAYLDGELDAEEIARVELLLENDRSVRDQLAVLRRTVDLVAALPRHDAPGALTEDLQAQLERAELISGFPEPTPAPELRRTPLLAILSTAAVFAVIATGMWYAAQSSVDNGQIADSSLAAADAGSDDVGASDGGVSARRERAPRARAERSVGRRMSQGADELLASATLEQKLAVGLGVSAVRTHAFANEPVRLHLGTNDARAQKSITTRVLARLAKMGLVNASAPSEARSMKDAAVPGLFYRGAAHRNFSEGGGTQILVRASPRQLYELLSSVSRGTTAVSSVKLSSGPLVVRGLSSVRSTFAKLESADDFHGDPLGALANVLGVDRTVSRLVDAKPSAKPSRESRRRAKRSGRTASGGNPVASLSKDLGTDSYVTLVIEIAYDNTPTTPATR